MTSQALMALQPWIWREADRTQADAVQQGLLPAIADTAEILRRRVYKSSGLEEARRMEKLNGKGGGRTIPGRAPRVPFVDPYRRTRR